MEAGLCIGARAELTAWPGSDVDCSFSARACEHGPVAMPISWEELKGGVRPNQWNTGYIDERLTQLKRKNRWKEYDKSRRALTPTMMAKLR